jgi:Small metal-binding protein
MTKPISQALSCAGGLLLVLASASYAADTPAGAMASPTPEAASNPTPEAASNPPQVAAEPPANTGMTSAPAEQKASIEKTAVAPPVVSDPGKVYLIRENPFYWQHIDKSIEHARAAEIAGNMGQAAELLEHAKMSLMQAREAQRAGNVGGLNEGIANLRKALSLPTWLTQSSTQTSPSAQGADPQCIEELERQCGEVEPGSGRLQQCFDDKINNFSSMCQEKLKEGKAGIAAAFLGNKQQKELRGIPREEAAVRSATGFVREARKNLSQAAGTKYVEIQPQKATASN